MKKYLSILLAGMMILLSGCGLTVTKQEATTASSASDEAFVETDSITSTTLELTSEYSLSETKTTTTKAPDITTEKGVSVIAPSKTTTQTAENTTKKTTATTSSSQTITCTIEINCKTILNNMDNLRPEKKAFVPKDGIILRQMTVTVAEGSTVYDVVKSVCTKNNIQLEYVYTPGYDSQYIRGINQIYEKDCGSRSGWMYSVNGVFPNYGVNKYTLKNGDKIKILYTCDLGEDLGNKY